MRPLSSGMTSVIALLILLAPEASAAQELRIGAVQSWIGHDRLGSPVGFLVSLGAGVHGRIGLQLAYEQTGDRFRSFGSTCVGLIPPEQMDDCAPERQREVAEFHAVVFSVPLLVFADERVEIALTPALRWSWFESRRTGLRSGRRLDGDESMWGFGLGADVSFQPSSRFPVRAFLGAHGGVLGQTEYVSVADGYSPFDSGFSLAQAELGIAVRR